MTKQVVLKILFRNTPCGFFMAQMPDWKAKKYIADFLSGELKGVIGETDMPVGQGAAWSARVDDIAGMHTMEMEAVQSEQQQILGQITNSGRQLNWR